LCLEGGAKKTKKLEQKNIFAPNANLKQEKKLLKIVIIIYFPNQVIFPSILAIFPKMAICI
jgi:hypothetical protein